MKKMTWALLICTLSLASCFDRPNSEAPARSLGLASGPGHKCLKQDELDRSTVRLYIAHDTGSVTLHETTDNGVTMPHYITINNRNYNEFPLSLVNDPDVLSARRLINQEARGERNHFSYLRVYVNERTQTGFVDLYKVVTDANGELVSQDREALLATLKGCEKI